MLSLPAIQQLHDGFPGAAFTLVCGAWNRELALASGLFDRVVCLNVLPEHSGDNEGVCFQPQEFAALDLPQFDVAVDLRVAPDTRFLLGHVRARFKAGFYSPNMPDDMRVVLPAIVAWDDCSKGLHNRTLLTLLTSAVLAEYRAVESSQRQVRRIASTSLPKIPLPRSSGPLVGVNVGAGSGFKEWPLERFVLLVRQLIQDYTATIVLFGSQRQSQANRAVVDTLPVEQVLDYSGRLSLVQFSTVVNDLDLYIGNDTGTTHIAAATGRPTICLFSDRASFTQFQPTGPQVTTIHADYRGMSSIGVDDVYDEATVMLRAALRNLKQH
ncbi:MAG: glycosyltransferase family 9 protein [Planctomycetia bacterium]|nr:glycosyltransferase family 9 protein [Planctomycetia bacterium]